MLKSRILFLRVVVQMARTSTNFFTVVVFVAPGECIAAVCAVSVI